jgi:hypothetical protein
MTSSYSRLVANDVSTCITFGGPMVILAFITDPAVITPILDHLGLLPLHRPHQPSETKSTSSTTRSTVATPTSSPTTPTIRHRLHPTPDHPRPLRYTAVQHETTTACGLGWGHAP